MGEGIEGLDALRAVITRTRDKTAIKAAKAGVNAGLTVLAKAIKNGVDSSSMSLELKQACRDLIGKRLKKKEGDEMSGKAGFAVGKQSKAKREAQRGRKALRDSLGHAGVGISSNNIQWLLGTKERHLTAAHPVAFAGEREQKRQGDKVRLVNNTGAMPDFLSGIIAAAVDSCEEAMLSAAGAKVQKVLLAEAAKH